MNAATRTHLPKDRAGQHLFSPLTIRSVTFENRIAVSPMCQYSAEDGMANDWHLVHLGSRAVGGAGLVLTEATAVEPRGRITPFDLGIWDDRQIEPLARLVAFMKRQGAVPGIQLAHAGRKASCRVPWDGGSALPPEEGGWQTVAPSPVPFKPQDPRPAELDGSEIQIIVAAFAAAARRARLAGFEVVEIHSAHGYLLHEFLSPVSNRRSDQYGGSLAGRTRFPLEVADAVRAVWPADLPVFFRLSATDGVEGGWDLEQSVELAVRLKAAGIDLLDCSSGGLLPDAHVPATPGYQVPFAARISRDAGILVGAVGLITQPEQADQIIRSGQADLVLLAREFLRDPYFPIRAARALEQPDIAPVQYARAFPAPQK
ncbi:MAG: NADH:flavin oxidoreductase/NADH oxidase [Gemmatimonadota bacterium]|nr:MAG: NADH:flavin oxidoreductase/NADH oxidase [Gemmatimonadota bacterium]